MTATLPSHKPLHWLYRFLAILVAQAVVSFLATSLVGGFNRAAVLLVVFPLTTMLVCATDRFRSRYNIQIVIAATVAALATIHLLRNCFDLTWFVGPCPPEMEFPGDAILMVITIACAGCTCVVFSSTGGLRKSRWVVVGAIAVLLIGLAVLAKSSVREPSPSDLLQSIARIERQQATDPGMMQQLSVLLAECGREADAESVQLRDR